MLVPWRVCFFLLFGREPWEPSCGSSSHLAPRRCLHKIGYEPQGKSQMFSTIVWQPNLKLCYRDVVVNSMK